MFRFFTSDPSFSDLNDILIELIEFLDSFRKFGGDIVSEVGSLDDKGGKFVPKFGTVRDGVIAAILPQLILRAVIGALVRIGPMFLVK